MKDISAHVALPPIFPCVSASAGRSAPRRIIGKYLPWPEFVRGASHVKPDGFTFPVTYREARRYSCIGGEVVQEFNNIADVVPPLGSYRSPLNHIGKHECNHDGDGKTANEDSAAQRCIEDNPALTRLARGKFTRARILAASELIGAFGIGGPVRHHSFPFPRKTMGDGKRSIRSNIRSKTN
ncbi:MAG: hypothetical protein L0I29_14070 [Hyphomicrobiales bacterium]|nr:hypothetical protein [Hyphomicrobiales bacterium]